MFGIAPRLQEHELSAQPIAIALATMASSMTSAITIMGTNIPEASSDPVGSKRAADFLKKYRENPSSKNLPASFWMEFEALASLETDGQVVSPSPPAGASSSSSALALPPCGGGQRPRCRRSWRGAHRQRCGI